MLSERVPGNSHAVWYCESYKSCTILGERNELSGTWAFLEMTHQDERSWLHREKERASDKHAESEGYR